MVVYSTELARRYGDDGIVSIGINPGNIKTELQRHMGAARKWMAVCSNSQMSARSERGDPQDQLLYPVELGALTQLYAGTMPDAANYNGKASQECLTLNLGLADRQCAVYDSVGACGRVA